MRTPCFILLLFYFYFSFIAVVRAAFKATNFKFRILKEQNAKKMQTNVKSGVPSDTWPTLKIFQPLIISGTAKATNFRCVVQFAFREYYAKMHRLCMVNGALPGRGAILGPHDISDQSIIKVKTSWCVSTVQFAHNE